MALRSGAGIRKVRQDGLSARGYCKTLKDKDDSWIFCAFLTIPGRGACVHFFQCSKAFMTPPPSRTHGPDFSTFFQGPHALPPFIGLVKFPRGSIHPGSALVQHSRKIHGPELAFHISTPRLCPVVSPSGSTSQGHP